MAITSYSELQTAMQNWLDRTDLSSRIPEFIALFEAKVNRKLRERQQVATATITMTSGVGTLPTDFLEWRNVTSTSSGIKTPLDYVTPAQFDGIDRDSPAGPPQRFTIVGSTIKVMPIDDTATVTMTYNQQVPALSNANTTNWLLTSHPDGYLFGSLTMSATYTEDADTGQNFNILTAEIMGDLWDLTFANKGPVAQRVLSPTP